MAVIRAQAVLLHQSGLARDNVVNTFHFNGPADATAGGVIIDAIREFYETTTSTGQPVGNFISDVVTDVVVKLYDVTAEPAGPPFMVAGAEALPSRGGTKNLPSEVAACLSFEGTPTTGLVQTRRRGRVYIGPLRDHVITTGAGFGIPRPGGTFRDTLTAAALRLSTHVDATSEWVIYSRPTAGRDAIVRPGRSTLPAIAPRAGTTVDISRTWVDDAFDTQRRRGERATGRGTIVATA